MKEIYARTTLIVMGLFAYLLLSIVFYQKAMAEECNVFNACFIHDLANSTDSEDNNMAAYAVSVAVSGVAAGYIDSLALVVMLDDQVTKEKAVDVHDAAYASARDIIFNCRVFNMTGRDLLRSWLTFTLDYGDSGIGTITTSYMVENCTPELYKVLSLMRVNSTDPKDRM